MLRVLLLVCLALAACKDCSIEQGSRPYDAGPLPEVDAAVLADLAARFVAFADRQATQRCQCAGDVPYCRQMLEGDWDAAGIVCLESAIRFDPTGVDSAVTCLENAVTTLESCQASLVCADVDERDACKQTFVEAASLCLQMPTGSAQTAIANCDASTPDSGM